MKTFPLTRAIRCDEGFAVPPPAGDLLTSTTQGDIVQLWEVLSRLHDAIAIELPDADETSEVVGFEAVARRLLVELAQREGMTDILASWQAGRAAIAAQVPPATDDEAMPF